MTKSAERNAQDSVAVQADASTLSITEGALVKHPDGVFRIAEVLSFYTVLGHNVESGRAQVLAIAELRRLEQDAFAQSQIDLNEIDDNSWRAAQERLAALQPLLGVPRPSKQQVVDRAKELGKDPTTLYRWLKRYRSYDATSALVPYKPGWRQGRGRLSPTAEKVMREVIDQFYLTLERPTPTKAWKELNIRCGKLNMPTPSLNALKSRIERIPEYERLKRRGRLEQAKNRFLPVPGSTPNMEYPLSRVEIDHTRVDVILVDDVHRRPLDRPWVTVAIDCYSRMVVGYYLSFDAPSRTSIAMCLAQAMLPKDEWLLAHGVEAKWPVWGRPKLLVSDNGADFRSKDFARACENHNIDLQYRPVRVPRYGSHIERLQGTLLREIHDLPGTTFSNVAEREDYDSDGRAVMTLGEFERAFLKLVCNEYHRRVHSSLGMPPLRKLEFGVFGTADSPGTGMPPRPEDRTAVLLSFLPSFERTIQHDGVTLDSLRYYDDCLRAWIGEADPETGKSRTHLFRRDPRDVSSLWFWDPEIKRYFKVPLADLTAPAFSHWEHVRAKAAVKQLGYDPSDEKAVFRSIAERREEVKESAAKTKRARKEHQRNLSHQKAATPGKALAAPPPPAPPSKPTTALPPPPSGLALHVTATDDIE